MDEAVVNNKDRRLDTKFCLVVLRVKYTIFMCGHFHKCRSTLHFCVQNSLCTFRQTGQVGLEKNDPHIISKAKYNRHIS